MNKVCTLLAIIKNSTTFSYGNCNFYSRIWHCMMSIYEGHPINSGNFFIIQTLTRLAYQNYIVSMGKHVAHIIHYPKFISGQ